MTLMEIISSKVKSLLASGVITNTDIEIGILEVEQAIKNYCNIEIDEILPQELMFVHANMTVDLIKYTYISNSSGEDDNIDTSQISSIKMGDTTVQIGSASSNNTRTTTLRSHRPNLDEIVMNYKQQLNRFRKMVW